MKNTTLKSKVSKGFSLIEMLVVIAVIGVIAAIAIPNIAGVKGAAETARDKRNAQSIVSMYEQGVAAGAVFDGASQQEVAEAVVEGRSGADEFINSTFSAPGITVTAGVLSAIGTRLPTSVTAPTP